MSDVESLGGSSTGLQWRRLSDFPSWNRYAAVNDEFIDLHMSDAAAIAAGQPGAFGMGNLRIAYYYAWLEHLKAPAQRIREFSCKFTALSFAGDTLEIGADHKDVGSEIQVELTMRNQHGIDTTPARAILGAGYADSIGDECRVGSVTPTPGEWAYLDQRTLDLIGDVQGPFYSYPVDPNDIRRWERAVWYPATPPSDGHVPQGFTDRESQTGAAPGDFNPFAWHPSRRTDGFPWMRGMGTTVGYRGLNGGLRFRHYNDIHAGDVLESRVTLLDAYEKIGSAGKLLFLIDRDSWTNQRGELVRVSDRTTIYY
ncbi:MaoC family dehydratase N-terminal domain-containing protein [Nocardia sp. NPDC059177]|uniref:FAS1-like dehydratase domain-containing protein n=1 Tax=Nocardia sp. NPDC059177 TaxID=3346759 RepID=UPI0036C53EC3